MNTDNFKSVAVSEKNYWESTYRDRTTYKSPVVSGYKGVVARQIEEKIAGASPYKSIIEIGGGGSDWLIYLYKKFKPEKIAALDYTESGCQALEKKAKKEHVPIKIIKDDILSLLTLPDQTYELVFSLGFAEHFSDLSEILLGKKKFLSKDGVIITIIPNMAGLNGLLTKFLDKSLYNIHVPYTLEDMKTEHIKARLEILDSGYICSLNFGVLSACKINSAGGYLLYKILSLIGRIHMLTEHYIFRLPTSKVFSPYIYIISKTKKY